MNIGQHVSLIVTVIVLLAFSAFFSGTETAFFSLSRFAVAEMENGGGRRRAIAALLREPRKLLVTILFGNLLVNIANTALVTALAIGLFGEKGVGIAVAVMTFLILVFGEITPKSLAIKNADRFSVAAIPVIRFFIVVFTPIRMILEAIANAAVDKSREIFGESQVEYRAHELAKAVETGYQQGLFDAFEKEVLTNLFLFAQTTVHEILTPRVDVFALDVRTPLMEAVHQVRSHGFSRVPLYEGQPDNLVGVLHAKDLLRHKRDERLSLRDIMRPSRFTPESKRIRELFGELISSHEHLVIVVDEHGSFAGIVTLEDILEEIFGEIRDRREPKVDEYMLLNEHSIVTEGDMRIEDFNEIFRTDLESDEVETIAGYLTEMVGRIPREGEAFELEGLRFLILSAEQRRVHRLKIERLGEGEVPDVPR
ncbi:MAG: HlyC/CorC family transporter [bacterium]|nr:MAG: HlyC/CorC family transporter [bacterium]